MKNIVGKKLISRLKKRKFLIVTGGVLSGLGKGVTAASLGFFYSDVKKVVAIKLDGYLNSDPGTMNPIEHGEVFVLDDGAEVDMDFGHYERFLATSTSRNQSITMGKIFQNIRVRERRGDFLGKTVQFVPHVTDLIQEKILKVAKEQNADLVVVEVGGTVGDLENDLFVEGVRQLKKRVGPKNIAYIHLSYIPIPYGVKEQKTKPTQQSIDLLHKKGIWPDIIIGRCSEKLEKKTKEKIALFANLEAKDIFSAPDVSSVYKLPQVFYEEGVVKRLSEKLGFSNPKTKKLKIWNKLIDSKREKIVKIAIAGKYTNLEDSYASVVEALEHSARHLACKVEIVWFDTENFTSKKLRGIKGIIVPGGFGSRGVEGKIKAIKFARENKIPYLGICYGLQLAVVEYLRNVCGDRKAISAEVEPNLKNSAITLLDEQENVVKLGGTMRLGAYEAYLQKGIIETNYLKFDLGKKTKKGYLVSERHRHRYEVNPEVVSILEKNKMKVSGKSKERNLVEFIELPNRVHPYFVATQSHPELKSKLEAPAPLFYGLVKAALKK